MTVPSTTTAPPQVANPYLAHLRACMAQARTADHDASGALRNVTSLMAGGAWRSASADAFAVDVTGQQRAASGGSGRCVAEIETAIASQPERVDPTSWQAHYRNF